MVEDDDVFKASCSSRTVFLSLSGCSSVSVSDPLQPMMTPSERDSPRVSYGSESLGREGMRMLKTLGLPLGHLGHFQSQGSSSRAPLAQRVVSGGETHVCQPKGEEKNCSLSARKSGFDRVHLTSHVLQQEGDRAWPPLSHSLRADIEPPL